MAALLKYAQFWLILLYFSYLGLTPEPEGLLTENFSDKILHWVGYLILSLSAGYAYRPRPRLLAIFILLLFCYSAAIETAQHFIPNRGFSIGDLLANLAGLLSGGLLYLVWQKKPGSASRRL